MANQVTGLVATAASTSEIDLYWDDVATLTGEVYDVERDGVIVGNDYAGAHTPGSPYQDTGLSPGTAYTYRVRAVNGTEAFPSVSGLKLRYHAGTIVGLTDGQALNANWADQSGNGNDAVNTTPPTYKTASGPNSLPWLQFNNAGPDKLTIPNVLNAMTAGTLFLVVKCASVALQTTFGAVGQSADGLYPFNDGKIYERFGTTVRKDTITSGVTMTNWHIYTVRTAAGAYDCRQNGGTAIFTTGTNTVAFPVTPTIGYDNTSNPQGIGIAEYVIYSASLSLADVNTIGVYLGGKYSITWTTAT